MLAPLTTQQEPRGMIARINAVVSLPYLVLRSWAAISALLAGLVQNFVFARVLDPERFSWFILVGAVGATMLLFDFGLSKILYVAIRRQFLSGNTGDAKTNDTSAHDNNAAQATAVALFYTALVTVASVGCGVYLAYRSHLSGWDGLELGLFLFFYGINMAWFVLRNVSMATENYIAFELLDGARKLFYIVLLLMLYAGLPFHVFILAINLGWIAVFAIMAPRLGRRGALATTTGETTRTLKAFFSSNRAAVMRTGLHAAGEFYIHNVLYLVVPLAYGLGGPTIIADTALKVFLGLLTLCSAACDLMVPRQTAAFAANNARSLARATLTAYALCALPALTIIAALAVDAHGLFALLLGPAATMPPGVTPVLMCLLVAAVGKVAPNFLLQHTGYFRDIGRLSAANIVVMTAALGLAVWAGASIVQLLAVFTAVIAFGSLLYIAIAIRGPIGHARAARLVVAPA